MPLHFRRSRANTSRLLFVRYVFAPAKNGIRCFPFPYAVCVFLNLESSPKDLTPLSPFPKLCASCRHFGHTLTLSPESGDPQPTRRRNKEREKAQCERNSKNRGSGRKVSTETVPLSLPTYPHFFSSSGSLFPHISLTNIHSVTFDYWKGVGSSFPSNPFFGASSPPRIPFP